MSFTFQTITSANQAIFETLYEDVFSTNVDARRVDLKKKLTTSYVHLSQSLSFITYDQAGNVAGAVGLYPVQYINEANELRLAAQIGDAMVYPAYRKQSLFTQMIEFCKQTAEAAGIDFIFTFPGLANQGSYKAFVKTKFTDIGSLTTYVQHTAAALWPRLLRRVSNPVYTAYCNRLNSVPIHPEHLNTDALIPRSEAYIEYKKFNPNHLIRLSSGSAWVSLGRFTVNVGDFRPHDGRTMPQFRHDLNHYARRTGKDQLVFATSIKREIELLDSVSWDKVHDNTRIMLFEIAPTSLKRFDGFNFADIDTF